MEKDKAAHTTARKAYEPSSDEWSLPRQSGSSLDSYWIVVFFFKALIYVEAIFFTYLSIILPMAISLPGVNSYIGNGVSSEICYNPFYKHVISLPFRCDRVAFFLWNETNQKRMSKDESSSYFHAHRQ